MVDPSLPREGEVDRPAGLIVSNHPTDVPAPSSDRFVFGSGVLHARISDGSIGTVNYFLTDVGVGMYPVLTNYLQADFRMDEFVFTPYSSATEWIRKYGATEPLNQVITSQTFLNEVMQRTRNVRQSNNGPSTSTDNTITMAVDDGHVRQNDPPGANLFSPPGINRQGGTNPSTITPATAARTAFQPTAATGTAHPSGLAGLVAQLGGATAPATAPAHPMTAQTPATATTPAAPDAAAPAAPPAPAVAPATAPRADPLGLDFMSILQNIAAAAAAPQQTPAQATQHPATPPQRVPPPAPPVDPTVAILLYLQQQQQQMQLQMQEHTRQIAESFSKSKSTSPSVSWPKLRLNLRSLKLICASAASIFSASNALISL